MTNDHTRRDVLAAIAKAGSVTAATGVGATGYRVSTLPMDLRNLEMATNVVSRLTRSAPVDWRYSWESLADHASSLPPLASDTTEGLQAVSAEAGFVSTAHDGIAAGVTETGRMSTLLFPHTGFTHQLPYYAHDRKAPVMGAKPREGGFAGLHSDDRTTWLWNPTVTHELGYVDDTGILSIQYTVSDTASEDAPTPSAQTPTGAGLTIEELLYVLPKTETVVREYTFLNETANCFDGQFVYHTQANVTDNQQNFAVWQSSPNRLRADESLRWTDRNGPYELLVYGDRPVVHSGGAVTGPAADASGQSSSPDRTVRGTPAFDGDRPTDPDSDLDTDTDTDTDTTQERVQTQPGLLGRVLNSDQTVVDGRYLSGYLAFDLTIDPGDRESVAVFVTGGENVTRLANGQRTDRQQRLRQARRYWSTVDDRLRLRGIPERYHVPARRAAQTVLMLVDPASGSISASGNLQPSYYPSWPRDGAFGAVALARMGLADPAKRFLQRYLPAVQEADGSFRQCYDSRGGDAGLLAIENDQQPIYAWAAQAVYTETGDDDFLTATWPAVQAALEYTVDAVSANGLLVATPDIEEGPESARQSLWTNAMAYEGLLAGSVLAAEHGADPTPYRQAATTVGTALHDRFFNSSEYVTEVGFWGPAQNLEDYSAGAIWPSRWAVQFDEIDRLADDLKKRYEKHGINWIPGELLTVAALDRAGHEKTADTILAKTLEQTTPAGYLAEDTTDDGAHKLGSPLGWASANLLLVLDKRYR